MLKSYLNLPRTVYIMCIGTFINRIGTLLVPFLTLYVRDSLNLSVGFATLAMGAFGLGSFFASIVGGHLADRIGRRPVLLISLFGGATILVGYSFVTTPWMVLVVMTLFGAVSDMYRPAAMAVLADVCEPEQRTHAFGLVYFSINLGFAIGPVMGGYLVKYSFQWLFWIDATTAALYGVVILLAIKETLPSRAAKLKADTQDGASEGETDSPTTASDEEDIPFFKALGQIVHDKTFMTFCIATFLTATVFMQSMSTFPLYLDSLGIGAVSYGKIIALNSLMIVLFQLPLTNIISRYHRGTMLVIASLITAVGFGLQGFALLPWHFALAVAVWTFGEITAAPLTNSITADLAPVRLRARYMGMLGLCISGSLMIGAPLGGLVLEKFGGRTLWTGCFTLAILATFLQLSVRKKLGRQSKTASSCETESSAAG
jgi:MFS family permease